MPSWIWAFVSLSSVVVPPPPPGPKPPPPEKDKDNPVSPPSRRRVPVVPPPPVVVVEKPPPPAKEGSGAASISLRRRLARLTAVALAGKPAFEALVRAALKASADLACSSWRSMTRQAAMDSARSAVARSKAATLLSWARRSGDARKSRASFTAASQLSHHRLRPAARTRSKSWAASASVSSSSSSAGLNAAAASSGSPELASKSWPPIPPTA
mmetsp:Transcript_10594/g.35030  ORF Transcript_10594/g.35030 Transcript_10594/m.35030 type:complete len:213 (-) Transcript_10594:1654-2292(-)